MNNLNKDFIQVGVSDRTHEYDSHFIKNKKKQLNNFLNNVNIGSDDWNKEVESLNVTIDEVMKILSEFDKTSQGPDKISIDVLKKVPK